MSNRPDNPKDAESPEGCHVGCNDIVNAPTAKDIQSSLIGWLRYSRMLVMGNVFVKGSPWESDVITVTPAYYWHEYEIKLTVADFRNDFQKKTNGFDRQSPRKHDVYPATSEIVTRRGTIIPKPKSFSFVVPRGLLDNVDVPEHCGIIEYGKAVSYWDVSVKRPAPTLPKATKLGQAAVFNLALKLASRFVFQEH